MTSNSFLDAGFDGFELKGIHALLLMVLNTQNRARFLSNHKAKDCWSVQMTDWKCSPMVDFSPRQIHSYHKNWYYV